MNNTSLHNIERIERMDTFIPSATPFHLTRLQFFDADGACHEVCVFSDARINIEEVQS